MLMNKGFTFIDANAYLEEGENSLKQLNERYESDLQVDGPRRRAYLKLEWNRTTNAIKVSQNQCYFQSAASNKDDGGKLRQFAVMDPAVLELPILKNLIDKNIKIIIDYGPLLIHHDLVFGLHFIQYIVDKDKASYSSPVGLHIDDEPLVFVHLLDLSTHALGGDNLIARLDNQEITNVIRLESPMETILLNNNCYHAVTPLGSKEGLARRNILLFTVEPGSTQVSHNMEAI